MKFVVIAASLLATVRAEEILGKSSVDCGRFIHHKVFFGNQSEIDDFPWLVLLEYDTPFGLSEACGGVLITNHHVLTAAHCVANIPLNWTLARVRLGEYDTTTSLDCFYEGDYDNTTTCLPKALSIPIVAKNVHESYNNSERHHDLAVIRLAVSVNITPICLPNKAAQSRRFHAAGWGRLAGRYGSGPKLRSIVSLFDVNICKDGYALYKIIPASDQFCAGGKANEWPCFGDSGGPLMGVKKMDDGSYKMAVYGILTTDSQFCDVDGWPMKYTDVFYHLDWIRQQIL